MREWHFPDRIGTHLHHLLIALLTSLCLMEIGCHGRSVGQIESRLELIDSLTATRPDSALLGLESMRGEPMSRRERIFFELLHGKATVLARLPYTADSVMRQVVDYYDRHGDIARQAEARYLLACAFFDNNQPSHAMRQLKHLSLISDTNTSPSRRGIRGRAEVSATSHHRQVKKDNAPKS